MCINYGGLSPLTNNTSKASAYLIEVLMYHHHLFHDNNSHWVKLQIKERESMTKKQGPGSLAPATHLSFYQYFVRCKVNSSHIPTNKPEKVN
jgi:hypothetical protein